MWRVIPREAGMSGKCLQAQRERAFALLIDIDGGSGATYGGSPGMQGRYS
jgi:hypothetical protein